MGTGGEETGPDLHGDKRAGDRDRTGMTSLEGWGSTIELRPRGGDWTSRSGRAVTGQRTGSGEPGAAQPRQLTA